MTRFLSCQINIGTKFRKIRTFFWVINRIIPFKNKCIQEQNWKGIYLNYKTNIVRVDVCSKKRIQENEMNATTTNLSRNYLWVLIVGAVFLASCKSGMQAMNQLTEVENLIGQVEEMGGSQFAASELTQARNKMEEANQLADEKKYDQAVLKAQKAQVDAELAEIKTILGKADQELNEIKASTQSLKDKIQELNMER